MLSSVLKTPRATALNIEIMRVFVRLRQVMASPRRAPHSSQKAEPMGFSCCQAEQVMDGAASAYSRRKHARFLA